MDNRFENSVIAVVLIISFGIYACLTLRWNPLKYFNGSGGDQQANIIALEKKVKDLEAKMNSGAPSQQQAQQQMQTDNSLLGQSMPNMPGPEEANNPSMPAQNPITPDQAPKTESPSPLPTPTPPGTPATTTPTTTATSTTQGTNQLTLAETIKKLQDLSKQATVRVSEMQSYIGEANTLYSSDEDTYIKYTKIAANFYDDRDSFKKIKVDLDVRIASNHISDFTAMQTKFDAANTLFEAHKKELKTAQSQVGTVVKTSTSTTPATP